MSLLPDRCQAWSTAPATEASASPQPDFFLAALRLRVAPFFADADRAAADRVAEAAPPRLPPRLEDTWVSFLPRPEPLLLPPPLSLFTVAQACAEDQQALFPGGRQPTRWGQPRGLLPRIGMPFTARIVPRQLAPLRRGLRAFNADVLDLFHGFSVGTPVFVQR
jgi:hypothetical protein